MSEFKVGQPVITTGGWTGAGVRGEYINPDGENRLWFKASDDFTDPSGIGWRQGQEICVVVDYVAADDNYHPITPTVEASRPPLVAPRTATDDLRDSAQAVIALWHEGGVRARSDLWENFEMHLVQLEEAVRLFDVAAARVVTP